MSAPTRTADTDTVPATERQISYITSLLASRQVETVDSDRLQGLIARDELTKKVASATIDWLLKRDMRADSRVTERNTAMPDVPAGRYAITGADGTTKFYLVDRPTEGRYAGRTFLKIQASDDYHPIKNDSVKKNVLAAILEAGLREATIRYGHELGVCGRCGRTLTDEASRAAGIGPVCAGKGW